MNRPVVVGVDGTGRSLRALLWAAHDGLFRVRPLRIVHALPRWEVDFPIFPPGRFEEAESHGRSVTEDRCSTPRPRSPPLAISARARGWWEPSAADLCLAYVVLPAPERSHVNATRLRQRTYRALTRSNARPSR